MAAARRVCGCLLGEDVLEKKLAGVGVRWGDFHLAWETESLNAHVGAIARRRVLRRALQLWFGCGAVAAALLQLAATAILVYNLVLMLRGLLAADDTAAKDMNLVPVLPDSQAGLLNFWLTAVVAFGVHELGHALSAVVEGLRLFKAGVFLTTLVPGAYVQIEDLLRYSTPAVQLRVYAAGVWHNLALCAASWLLLQRCAAPGNGLFFTRGGGLVVLDVQASSPLSRAVLPGSVLTQVDGLPVGSSAELAAAVAAAEPVPWAAGAGGGSGAGSGWDPEARRRAQLWLGKGFCLEEDAEDAFVPLDDDDSGDPGCCDAVLRGGPYRGRGTGRCFARSDEALLSLAPAALQAATTTECLSASTVSEASEGRCSSDSDCQASFGGSGSRSKSGVCWRPLAVGAPETLLSLGMRGGGSVLFEGEPRAVLAALRVSEHVARLPPAELPPSWHATVLLWAARAIETASESLRLLLQASASLAIANAVPCVLLDGSLIFRQLLRVSSGGGGGGRGCGGRGDGGATYDGELGAAAGAAGACLSDRGRGRLASAVVAIGTALLAANVAACTALAIRAENGYILLFT